MSLTKMNCTVDVAEDGTQALEAVTKSIESNHPYQLILMDLRMPNMDGFEATRMLKEVMKYSVPIVALTAETGADVRERCKEIGFDKFVQKPLRGALLKSILDQFCQHVTE
jgi:CheY-like chemotaxis protein